MRANENYTPQELDVLKALVDNPALKDLMKAAAEFPKEERGRAVQAALNCLREKAPDQKGHQQNE